MKCLARLQVLGGGAPKSIFEYLKILKENNYSITTIAQSGERSIYARYLESFGRVILRDDIGTLFDRRRIGALYKAIREEKKILEKEMPNLVIVQGENNAFFYSYLCKRMAIPLIIIIAGGDLKPKSYLIKGWEYGQVICFSKENKEVISQYYPKEKIHTISNRIQIKQRFEDEAEHYCDINHLNVLIVSRIDEDKISSIICFLDFIMKETIKDRLEIRIAGTGSKMEDLQTAISKSYGQHLNIQLMGHVNDLTEAFRWAHIVAGKGRSVIEPIMMNRIGCIIANNGESCICNHRSFENLYHYNFAGRNITNTEDENSFLFVVQALLNESFDLNSIHQTARLVEEYYSTDFLPDKLKKVVQSEQCAEKRSRHVCIFPKYIRFLAYKIRYKVKKKI